MSSEFKSSTQTSGSIQKLTQYLYGVGHISYIRVGRWKVIGPNQEGTRLRAMKFACYSNAFTPKFSTLGTWFLTFLTSVSGHCNKRKEIRQDKSLLLLLSSSESLGKRSPFWTRSKSWETGNRWSNISWIEWMIYVHKPPDSIEQRLASLVSRRIVLQTENLSAASLAFFFFSA